MFHGLALRLGLVEPNVHDVVGKLIDMYFEDPDYIDFSTSEKQITINDIKYNIFIVNTPDGYELWYGSPENNTHYGKIGDNFTCQFIAEHLPEIQDILEDMAKNGKSAYESNMKERQQHKLDEEQKNQQEKKCLKKIWRHLE